MKKAQKVFEKLSGLFNKSMKYIKEVKPAEEAAKMINMTQAERTAKQVESEIIKGKLNYDKTVKVTKGQSAEAEKAYVEHMDSLNKGLKKKEGGSLARTGVNTLAGIGAVGLAGVAYNEHKKGQRREQYLASITARA